MLLTLAIALTCYTTHAQTNKLDPTGNVGIGTTSPISALHVSGLTTLSNPSGRGYDENLRLPPSNANDFSSLVLGATPGASGTGIGQWTLVRFPAVLNYMFSIRHNETDYLNILTNGNMGIGTSAPQYKLNVAQDITMDQDINIAQFGITGATDNAKRLVMGYDVNGSGFGYIKAGWYNHGWTNLALQPLGGNVGIGTTTPDSKLAVNGTIHSTEVKVDMNGWPDYVFKPEYDLLPLSDVKNYIDKNQHLPEVPSAQEIAKDGLNLGEMNKLLIKKIEELTLYLIEIKKESESLKEKQKITDEKLNRHHIN